MGRRKKFENRFEIIVETAARLFLEKGFDGTTMDEIARECDLGKATLYAEFASKEALMGAVITNYVQQAHSEMKAKIDGARGNYVAVLRDILMNRSLVIYERINKHFHSFEVFTTARKEFREQTKANMDEEARILANLLEKAAANGEIAASDNYFRLAKLLRKGLAGLRPPHIFNVDREEFEQDARDIIGLLLAGLTVKR